MNEYVCSYDIHGLASLRIEGGSRRGPLHPLAYPYSFFATSNGLDPDLVVRLGPFEPEITTGEIIDHKYRVTEGGLYVRDHARGAMWEMEISGLESDQFRVRFNGAARSGILGLMPEFLAHNVVIRPLLELLIRRTGTAVIHAAAVEKDGVGYVLSGRGGVHKTSLVMDLVRHHDFRYLGDDHVLIQNEKVLAYPYLVDLFDFRVRHLKTEYLTPIGRVLLGLHMAGLCRGHKVSWRISESAEIGGLVELERRKVEGIRLATLDVPSAVRRMVASTKLELLGGDARKLGVRSNRFLDYLLTYMYGTPESRLNRLWDDVSSQFHDILRDRPLTLASVPLDYHCTQAQALVTELEEIYAHGERW